MNASTGVLTQALSAAAVNDGAAGVALFRKAHCLRSVSEYLSRGATASAANASETSTTTGRKYLITPALPFTCYIWIVHCGEAGLNCDQVKQWHSIARSPGAAWHPTEILPLPRPNV